MSSTNHILTTPSVTSNIKSPAPNSSSSWDLIYQQVPLAGVPSHFAGIAQSPYLLSYLSTVLRLCGRGGRALETGIGSGYGSVWLSLRGVEASGLDLSPVIVERATQVNAMLGGAACFQAGDLFGLYERFEATGAPRYEKPRYEVIHHQGVLEHFTVPMIRAALAQQVASAEHVVFSVPSVYYPFEPELGDERLLSLEDWEWILSPFEVEELRYAGDPQHGGQEQILATLRGQAVTPELRAMMTVADEPFPDGITAIVHTRNEAARIEECLRSLGFADEILVCDMESTDNTVELAQKLGAQVIGHPLIPNFDRARNVSAMRASYRWIFYLDADERVPEGLGQALRQIVAAQSQVGKEEDEKEDGDKGGQSAVERFDALLVPFRHHFAGHWMRCLYPGYTAPRLLRNGRFVFNARLHSGAQVEGLVARFPADDPNLAIVHYSYDGLAHYLDKLNRYTDGEALNLHRDGAPFHWQNAVREFVRDFQAYYEGRQAIGDGVHGFLYSFLSGFYRFEQHAKLYERRYHGGQLQTHELDVPRNLEEMLEFMLRVARDKPLPAPQPILVQAEAEAGERTEAGEGAEEKENTNTSGDIVWSGPLTDPSGYGEESRNFVFGLDEIGVPLAAQALPWSHDIVDMPDAEKARLEELSQVAVTPGFTQIVHNLAPLLQRHPQAGLAIGRTMFETDRLPSDWVRSCQTMDYVWVPSEFHRQSFLGSGVPAEKLVVIPEAIDTEAYFDGSRPNGAEDLPLVEALQHLPQHERELLNSIRTERNMTGKQFFLSVFDWTLHKGWDVLLRSFVQAFEGRDDAVLLLRVWSTMGYGAKQIQAQAAQLLREELGYDLFEDGRIRFLEERLSRTGLCALYALTDAFVLPSRGEGWGRPYMEAMASSKPTIGTNWSGNTAFMTSENSLLIDAEVRDVSERGWRELPSYKGHRWAEPDEEQLVKVLRFVADNPATAASIGARARADVLGRFNRQSVARVVERELQRIGAIQAIAEPKQSEVEVVEAEEVEAEEVEVEEVEVEEVEVEEVEVEKPSMLADYLGVSTSQNSLVGDADTNDAIANDVGTNDATPDDSESVVSDAQPIALRWEGALFNWHSLGHVNRELMLALQEVSSQKEAKIDLSILPTEPTEFSPNIDPRFGALAERVFAPLSQGTKDQGAQVHVRHSFPPRLDPVPVGRFVLIQPWEYGYLPQAWIEPIQEYVDQVWCHTQYLREVYLNSGIPASKLRLVPLGFDPQVFRPDALPYVFTDEPGARALHDLRDRDVHESRDRETFVFLYAGGSIHRKGIDILLEAYRRAFTSLDNVCLVIKDTGTSTVYRDANAREQILALSQDPNHPAVVYLNADLPAPQMAGVFAMADCLVQPYRGEGFCLPVLEAMACGTPVVVPRGGPTDDFVDETVGWPIEAQRQPFNIGPSGKGRVGRFDCVGPTWQFEVDPDVLAHQLRVIASDRGEARQRGGAAAQRAHSEWTWHHAAEVAHQILGELVSEELVSEEPLPEHPLAENVISEDLIPQWVEMPQVMKEQALKAQVQKGLEVKSTIDNVGQEPQLTEGNSNEGHTDKESPTSDRSLTSERKMAAQPQLPTIKPPTISLCMIVRDEERVLGACLASAKPWFDEIILVDTGSTDRTVEIAQQHGAKVFHFPWCDDFSAARNESLRHATGDWVFWMDADDTMPAECGAKLHDLALLAEDRVFGFIVQVHIPSAPGESGFTIVDHVKLFRNRPDLRFVGRIHEQILEPIQRAGGLVERSGVHIVHSGYDYSPQGQEKKRERDLTILEKDLAERPDHPFVLFNIGMTAYHMKEYPKALAALERCLQVSGSHESTVRKVYAMLAGCHAEQGEYQAARERLEQGLDIYPYDPELLFRAGIVYRELGDYPRAERAYLTLLQMPEQGHVDSLDVTMTGFKARHNLALIYRDIGELRGAEAQFRAALEAAPRFLPSWMGLAEVLLRAERLAEVQQLVLHLQSFAPKEAAELQARLARVPVAAYSESLER